MARTFKEALRATPLLFEPVPPSARAAPARADEQVAAVARLVRSIPRIDAIDVPELVDENHEGKPYYRSADPRLYARAVGEQAGREVLVNKVVAHLASPEMVEQWAQETAGRGLRHVVLVGGTSRYIPYPGPSVTEATRICRPIFGAVDGSMGNIAIPQRTGEAHRMLSKTRAGASFFTTQIVFDSEGVLKMVQAYDQLCRQASISPAAVVISVAPLADEGDAEFVRWLGADIPETAERSILAGEDAGAGDRSIERALTVWREVLAGAHAVELEVPLGVNVEQISVRHLATAAAMVEAFAREVQAPAGRPP